MCRERGRKRERREGEVVPKIYQKVIQKSSKNQPKIDQEETENPATNQSKIGQKSTTNRSWSGLERALEALGGQDRKMKGCTRFPGASWGRLGGLLGPSWRLDRRLGRSWGSLGPSKDRCQKRSKI